MTIIKIRLLATIIKKTTLLPGFVILGIMFNTITMAEEPPERIVSINLCTDQLLLQLADRRNIASITYMADDPKLSYFSKRAIGHNKNHGLAEQILPLKPDLIMAGAFSSIAATAILIRLGYNVVVFEIADDFYTLRNNILKAGKVIGKQAKAERLIARFDRKLKEIRPIKPQIPVIILQPRAAGTGKITLIDNILRKSGLRNASVGPNSSGVGWVTIEEVVVAKPDILIADTALDWPSLGHQAMLHPAYNSMRSSNGTAPKKIQLPSNLWNCAGVQVAKAIEILSVARKAVQNSRLSNGPNRQ